MRPLAARAGRAQGLQLLKIHGDRAWALWAENREGAYFKRVLQKPQVEEQHGEDRHEHHAAQAGARRDRARKDLLQIYFVKPQPVRVELRHRHDSDEIEGSETFRFGHARHSMTKRHSIPSRGHDHGRRSAGAVLGS